jgi:Plasmid pRiA4b ORF-3-like protein
VLIPAAYPLSRVHRVIQAAMGWEDCHLHTFQIGKTTYGPDPEEELTLTWPRPGQSER